MIRYNADSEELVKKINELQEYINSMSTNQKMLIITLDVLTRLLESKKIITKKQMQKEFEKMQDGNSTANKDEDVDEIPPQEYFDWLIEKCEVHGNA